mgnify:CR=1 FL=1|jgi:hypothetical protein
MGSINFKAEVETFVKRSYKRTAKKLFLRKMSDDVSRGHLILSKMNLFLGRKMHFNLLKDETTRDQFLVQFMKEFDLWKNNLWAASIDLRKKKTSFDPLYEKIRKKVAEITAANLKEYEDRFNYLKLNTFAANIAREVNLIVKANSN